MDRCGGGAVRGVKPPAAGGASSFGPAGPVAAPGSVIATAGRRRLAAPRRLRVEGSGRRPVSTP